MSVTPLTVPVPERGGIVVARDVSGRVLRITGHPESDRVVLSIWQGPGCIATLRLAPEDVPEVSAALIRAAVPPPDWVERPSREPADNETASVTRLPVRPQPDDSLGAIGADAAALARRGWRQVQRIFGPRDPRQG